jgi:signal transduction histidine kinase
VRDETGKALRIIGTATDVGQLTDAIRALEASEERFRIIADTVSDVLWDRDFDTNTMWVTPNWPDRLDVAIDPNVNQERFFLDHVEPEDASRVKRSFLEAIKSGALEWEIQYVLIGSDGAKIDLAVKAAILRHSDGRAHRMLGNARNVTIEKRQQEGSSRARALEAVGQLTGGVAHDFNNQLMIIQGNAELLGMSQLDEDQGESVDLINQACSSAADLTRRLLSFSRQSHLQTGSIDLDKLIPNTVALLRAGIPESIKVECKLPADIWQVKADANALEQAIVNLAVNARDAMPRGGGIVISCENRRVSQDIGPFSSELEPGDYVAVSVTDNGEGMPPEVLAKVFEPFYTTKDVGKGTGLGLSTVYGFAKQSNGKVTIYSEPGEGTTVNLYLPRFRQAGVEEVPEPSVEEAELEAGQRILLVEDQPEVMAHVEKLLTRMGYVVTAASNGKEALSLMFSGKEFDLLFTDVILPGGMNGQQLAEEVRNVDARVKVLFTSGYPAFAFEHLGLEEIDNLRLLRKPYRSADLKAVLSEMLGS